MEKLLNLVNDIKFRVKYFSIGSNREEVIAALKEIQIVKKRFKERIRELERTKGQAS